MTKPMHFDFVDVDAVTRTPSDWFLVAFLSGQPDIEIEARTLSVADPFVDHQLQALPLLKGPHSRFDFIALGRHVHNDVSVLHETVSRFHCYVRQHGDKWLIRDAGSSAGTFVNGELVSSDPDNPTFLHRGDDLRLGQVPLVLAHRNDVIEMLEGGAQVDISSAYNGSVAKDH